jgi:integrase
MSFRLRPPRSGKTNYWSAIVTTPDGQTFERSTKCTRKSDARVVADKWDREAATANHEVVTLRQAIEMLAEHKNRKRVSDATMEILSLKASHLISYFGEDRDVSTIKLWDTTEYLMHRREKGVSDATIEKELRELRAALRNLKRFELYSTDPTLLWPPELRQKFPGRKRWLSHAEYQQVLLAIAPPTGYWREQRHGTGRHGGAERRRQWVEVRQPMGVDWRDHLTTYVYTGARFIELYGIEAQDFDERRRLLRLRGTKTEKSDRHVPVHTELLAVLNRRASQHPSGPVFPLTSPDADSQSRAWLHALRRAAERAGVERFSTNDLRRTFVSWSKQAGVPEWTVIDWVGHTSSRLVREVYGRPGGDYGLGEIDKLPGRSSERERATRGKSGRFGGGSRA